MTEVPPGVTAAIRPKRQAARRACGTRQPAAAGKRVGAALYLHASAVPDAPQEVRNLVGMAARNVAKVTGTAVSLLLYEEFDEAAFPALLSAVRFVGGSVVSTDYRGRANPPVLAGLEIRGAELVRLASVDAKPAKA